MDTAKDWASTFRKEDHKEENQGGYSVPQLVTMSWNWENKDGNHRLQQVKGPGKSWWKVAQYTNKVTGLGTARALH